MAPAWPRLDLWTRRVADESGVRPGRGATDRGWDGGPAPSRRRARQDLVGRQRVARTLALRHPVAQGCHVGLGIDLDLARLEQLLDQDRRQLRDQLLARLAWAPRKRRLRRAHEHALFVDPYAKR